MNRVMTTLALLFVLALIACLVSFVAIVLVDRYHRSRSVIDMPLPKTIDEIKTPPDLFPVQPHDVKG